MKIFIIILTGFFCVSCSLEKNVCSETLNPLVTIMPDYTETNKKDKFSLESIDENNKTISRYEINYFRHIEPPRDCRRPNILRGYDNENTTLYP